MRSNEKTISFRADAEKIGELDELAAAQDRSRSYLINEAISNYVELHAYQDALVRQGLEFFLKYYREHKLDHTTVYAGVKEALVAIQNSPGQSVNPDQKAGTRKWPS